MKGCLHIDTATRAINYQGTWYVGRACTRVGCEQAMQLFRPLTPDEIAAEIQRRRRRS